MNHPSPTRRSHLKAKPLWITLGALLILVALIHLTLPGFLLRFGNQKLNEIPGYRGHISDIDLSLWRGAYQAQGVTLQKLEGDIPVPFFSSRTVDISVEWHALFHGKIVTEIGLTDPHLNFVAGPTDSQSQTSIDPVWKDKVRQLAPFRINHFRIHNGEIHFRDFHRQPKVDIHLDHLEVDVAGLTNASKGARLLPASVHVAGRAMDQAELRLDMNLAPLALSPTFDLNGELTGLPIVSLNDFLRAYANVDANQGTFGLFTEMTASDGRFKGYVKPLIKDIKIIGPEDKKKNPLRQLWEATVAGVTQIFENIPASQVGTQIPFSGKFSDPQADIWKTVGALLRNAFIRALKPQLDGSIHFGDAAPGRKPVIMEDPKKK